MENAIFISPYRTEFKFTSFLDGLFWDAVWNRLRPDNDDRIATTFFSLLELHAHRTRVFGFEHIFFRAMTFVCLRHCCHVRWKNRMTQKTQGGCVNRRHRANTGQWAWEVQIGTIKTLEQWKKCMCVSFSMAVTMKMNNFAWKPLPCCTRLLASTKWNQHSGCSVGLSVNYSIRVRWSRLRLCNIKCVIESHFVGGQQSIGRKLFHVLPGCEARVHRCVRYLPMGTKKTFASVYCLCVWIATSENIKLSKLLRSWNSRHESGATPTKREEEGERGGEAEGGRQRRRWDGPVASDKLNQILASQAKQMCAIFGPRLYLSHAAWCRRPRNRLARVWQWTA